MRFIWGIIIIAIGLLLMRYNYQLVNFFGHFSWAEEHLGGGGTYTLYKLVGVGVVILALLYMFGALDFTVGPLGAIFGEGQ